METHRWGALVYTEDKMRKGLKKNKCPLRPLTERGQRRVRMVSTDGSKGCTADHDKCLWRYGANFTAGKGEERGGALLRSTQTKMHQACF